MVVCCSHTEHTHMSADNQLHAVAICCHQVAVSEIFGTTSLWDTWACSVVGLSASHSKSKVVTYEKLKASLKHSEKCPLQPLSVLFMLLF